MTVEYFVDAMRRDMHAYIKHKRLEEVWVLRASLAAIENAEAVEPGDQVTHPAGAVGPASTDVDRRTLHLSDLNRILGAELDERREAAATYDQHGRPDEAARMRREVEILLPYWNSTVPEDD